jgi:hypothetical protein
MATITLSAEQADLIAEEIASRLGGVRETAGNYWEPNPLLEACEKIDPLRSALLELDAERTMVDLELLGEVALEALRNNRESAGGALSVIHHVKAGRVVEQQTSDAKTPDEIIAGAQAEADCAARKASLAQAVIWAIGHAESEVKAAEGDPRAAESVATHERWAKENQQLAEAI